MHWTFLIHVVALVATVAVLQLRFRAVYWADIASPVNNFNEDGFLPRADVLNSLQFLAKVHEVFIVASLSAMVMHVIRRMFVGSGVPFGLLMGAYQVSSPAWLGTKVFTDPILKGAHKRLRISVLLAGLLTIFANIVGPSSAVAMIPTVDWWPAEAPFNRPSLFTYVNRRYDDLYPRELVEPIPSCLDLLSTTVFECPASGFDNLLDWSFGYAHGNPGGENITISQPYVNTMRYLAVTQTPGFGDIGRALATTVTANAVSMFGHLMSSISFAKMVWSPLRRIARVKVESSDATPVQVPFIDVKCTFADFEAAKAGAHLVYFEFGELDQDFYKTISVPDEAWDVSHSLDSVYFNWEPVPGRDDLLGAIVMVPYVAGLMGDGTENELELGVDPDTQMSLIVPCTVQARWGPAKLSAETRGDDMVSSNISTQNMNDFEMPLESKTLVELYGLSDPIHITPGWASMLNIPIGLAKTFDNTLVDNATTMDALLLPWVRMVDAVPDGNGGIEFYGRPGKLRHFTSVLLNNYGSGSILIRQFATIVDTIAQLLAMATAEGLARSVPGLDAVVDVPHWEVYENGEQMPFYHNISARGRNITAEAYFINETDLDVTNYKLADGSLSAFEVWRYGWGYEVKSTTVRLSFTVLAIYVALLISFFVYSIMFRMRKTGWTSSAWGAAGDIVALALVSEAPPGMKVSGVDYRDRKIGTWAMNLFVRERGVGGSDRVQLLIGDDDPRLQDSVEVQVGKKYD